MVCPKCGKWNLNKVMDSRENKCHTYIKRRRACEYCGEEWYTKETMILPDSENVIEIKMEMNNLKKEIEAATYNSNIRMTDINAILNEAEKLKIQGKKRQEIVEYVGSVLRQKDYTCYVRYMSRYKNFSEEPEQK